MLRSSLAAIAITAALGWAQPPADDKPATIEGTVTNALTGEPLLRAHVTLRGMSGNNRRNIAALTDAEGKFSVSVPPGSYSAIVERVGYTNTNDRQGRMGAQVNARAGDKTEVKLKLNPNGAITGRVTDADGEPMEGVTVTAESSITRGMQSSVSTDEKGQFRLGGLAPGKYRVKARPMNQSLPPEIRTDGSVEPNYAQTYFPNSLTAKEATSVNVGIGAEVGGVAIQLVRNAIVRVSGTVTGAPPGERVMIEAMQPNFGSRQMGMLREDGSFQIWRLDPGKYFVSARLFSNGQQLSSAPVELEVSNANIDHMDLRMIPPSDIAGQVEYEDEQARQEPSPPPRAGRKAQAAVERKAPPLTLSLRELTGRSGSAAPVGADGSFKLEGLAPGRYRVSPSRNGIYVKSMRLGQTIIDGNILDLTGGSNGAALSLLVSSAVGEISGVVTDDKGPAAQVQVAAMLAGEGMTMFPAMAMTGADGAYKLTGMPPGKYRIVAAEDNVWARAQDEDAEELEAIEIHQGDKVVRDLKLGTREK